MIYDALVLYDNRRIPVSLTCNTQPNNCDVLLAAMEQLDIYEYSDSMRVVEVKERQNVH